MRAPLRACAALTMLVLALVAPGVAGAAVPPGQAELAIVNAWPPTEQATVAIRGRELTVPYLATVRAEVPAGSLRAEIRVAGATLEVAGELSSGTATLLIGPEATDGRTPAARLILDDRPTPDGVAAVRVLSAAPDLVGAAIHVDGAPWRTAGPLLESSGYADVPTGRHTLDVRHGGDVLRSLPVELSAGSVYTVVLRGFGESVVGMDIHVDAVGVSAVPRSFVATGTPPSGTGDQVVWVVAIGMLAVVVGLGGRRRFAAVVAAVLALAACSEGSDTSTPEGSSTTLVADPAPTTTTGAGTVQPAGPGEIGALRLPPQAVALPEDEVDIQTLGLTADGSLDVPSGLRTVGWYGGSAVPGRPGPAVLAAHVSGGDDPGAFRHLDRLQPGDPIEIDVDRETVTFVVYDTATYDKDEFPNAHVYAPTPVPELRLVTCTGQGELRDGRRVFSDNLVVFARQA